MSYYRPSFSQTVAMSRGSGRGYSSQRGSSSYRGSGRGGSSSWGERGGRGSFSSSRGGRFSSSWGNNSSNSFDSRSRYSSGGGNDRYSSSRGRNDDSSYKRSYRSDGPNSSYSSRDTSARSPDRKRLRTEAPSSRRSHGHDGGYGGDSYSGSGNTGRYESSGTGHHGYSDRRSFNEERRTSFRPRDEYRKPAPASGTGRSPRGSYRGSRAAPRGARGSRLAIMRRRMIDSSSYLRKRGATLRSTSDYLRRLRISRLRSAAARRTIKKSKSSEKESDKEEEEENWDDVTQTEKKKEEGSEKGEDEKEKRSTPAKKSPKKDKDKEESSDKDDKKSASDEEERPRSKYTGRSFIRLSCIHCGTKCVTFREYSLHLFSGRHITAMRKIALRQKAVLARMRQQQRNAQRELEKSDDTLGPRTIFCPLCKLNYRQLKAKHQMSDAHRNMKKFLMPYCRICHITFKSPMLYENHMCSLEHIKRKAQGDVANGEKQESDKEPESPAEEDLENFMTLDSVGDVDEEDEEGKAAKSPAGEEENPAKPKETINVGVEHVKKVEVYYCDLCRIYLSRHEEEDRILKNHCRGRLHLQRYVRYKEDKDLRRQAERIHRKSQEAKEAKEKEEKEKEKPKVKVEKDEKKEGDEGKPQTEQPNEEEGVEDKMWADVDKDLGEILAEVNTETGNKSDDDEDEDSRPDGERYDRFRLSEKGGEGKAEQKVEGNEKDPEEKEEIVDGEKIDNEKEKVDDKK